MRTGLFYKVLPDRTYTLKVKIFMEATIQKWGLLCYSGFPQLLEKWHFSSPGKELEFYNFIKNPGKMGVNLEKWIVWGEKVLSWLLQHSFLLYRALPIKMYIWEKFWDSWTSVVFSDSRVYGAIRQLGTFLHAPGFQEGR